MYNESDAAFGAQRLPASKLYSDRRSIRGRIFQRVLNAYRHQSYIQSVARLRPVRFYPSAQRLTASRFL